MLESPTINDSTDRKAGLAIDEDNQSDALELVFDYKVHGIDFKNTSQLFAFYRRQRVGW
jgi:hypothetical protein